jgi:beta-galactosidase
MPNPLTTPGKFLIGANYWASHAGMHMWSDWQPAVVEADLEQLAQTGLQVLRVFPLWPVFQPITQLYGGGGTPQEMRFGEEPLVPIPRSISQNHVGLSHSASELDLHALRAGLSLNALNRFQAFANLAEKYQLKLIVGLLTGWMSGRLFVPPALEGRNVLSDPLAILWETRFVRHFVRRFKESPAILAWDLGNECNVMAPVPGHEAAWAWTSAISNAIRVEDSSRPVVSGMHSLDEPDEAGDWQICDQAELTDLLTTHPYPYFTPHCDQEPINTLRNGLHATAQTRWYSDIGGVPALAEELGTLGPMFASPSVAAAYARTALFSLWAHDCHGLLWWCAYDQDQLVSAPYDWTPIERELGLIRSDRLPKPVSQIFSDFHRFLDGLPIPSLPPRLREAVCILTHNQEQWGIAYTSFILAKQAGFDLTFQYADQPLKDASLYLLPSVSGSSPFSRRFWYALDERIQSGATLYLSMNDAILSPFKEPFGLEVESREKRTLPAELTVPSLSGSPSFHLPAEVKYTFTSNGATLLGSEPDGNPAFTCHNYSKGQVYFLSVPIEQYLTSTPGAFIDPSAQPFWQIYRHIAAPHLSNRLVSKDNPLVGNTEHILSEDKRLIVLINYSPTPQEVHLTIADGWKIAEAWYGVLPDTQNAQVPPNDSLVWVIERKI